MALPRLEEDVLQLKGSKSRNQQAVRFSNINYLSALKNPNTPQAVIKVVKNPSRGNKVKKLLEYIARSDTEKKDDVELETSDGNVLQNKEEIRELYSDWKTDFERKKKNSKTNPRHIEHIIFSADCKKKEKNILRLNDCVRELAARNFNGYEYAFGIHQDGNKPHVHLVVKCKSREKYVNKLRIRKEDLFQLRQEFAEELTKRGLTHSSTLVKDRFKTIKKNNYNKAPKKTWFNIKLKDIQQETAFLKKQYNKIELSLKNADSSKKEKLYDQRNAIGKRVNQLKINIHQRTKPNSIQRNQSFNIVRKFERELKSRDPAFRNIIKRADLLNLKNVENYNFEQKIDKTPSHLKSALKNLEESFSEIEKENLSWKTKSTAYKDKRKFIGEQINQLKRNVKSNTTEGSRERLDSFKAIRKLERDLKKRDPEFKKIIKRAGDLKTTITDKKEFINTPTRLRDTITTLRKRFSQLQTKKTNQLNKKQYSAAQAKAEHMAYSLIKAQKIIKQIPDAKERKEAKKLLSDYTRRITKSSPEINRSYKNIKRKQKGLGR